MEYLTGILLDVSGSMGRYIKRDTDDDGGPSPWARSIFEVIDNLIKYDVSSENHVFAMGVGACTGEDIFDIIGTLKQIQNEDKKTENDVQGPATSWQIKKIFEILKRSGARTVDKWAAEEDAIMALEYREADLLLSKFESDKSFLKKFVEDFLPEACRDWPESPLEDMIGLSYLKRAAQSVYASVATTFVRATVEDIREVVNKAKPYLLEEAKEKVALLGVTVNSISNVQDASNVLHGCVDEKELSPKRSQELLESVEPYIYGRTPLFQSIEKAIKLFQASRFSSHKKLLFILSDGIPSDGHTTDRTRIDRLVCDLNTVGVTVVSCFVTDSTQIDPKRLYSEEGPDWDPGAKFLFSLSSKKPTQSLPRTMFVKRDWTVDITNNETHLFLQVNHPDNLREACKVARDVVYSQDALSQMLAVVDLHLYINQQLEGYEAKLKQKGATCYANAAATILHLSMKQILGREGGCPDFYKLREEFTNRFRSRDGDNTFHVLQKMCPKYRMRCQKVDLKGAMEAITSSRPVVATFQLTDPEWKRFGNFFKNDPKGILTKAEIDITARLSNTPTVGHAVVMTSFDSQCLRLLNSWGETWGNDGFFRVQNADVLGLEFIHVFCEKEDLTIEEKSNYEKHGSEVARKLIKDLPSLQRAEFKCPECSETSPVMEFTGTLSHAKCPKCRNQFYSKNAEEGNILVLNLYLTSLIR